MKYLFAIFLPPVAILGCGRICPGILNAILSVVSVLLLLSGLALSLTPLMEASGLVLFPVGVVLWLAACTHAFRIVNSHSAELLHKEEQAQLLQQLQLMREAATKHGATRPVENQATDVPPPPPQPQAIPQS